MHAPITKNTCIATLATLFLASPKVSAIDVKTIAHRPFIQSLFSQKSFSNLSCMEFFLFGSVVHNNSHPVPDKTSEDRIELSGQNFDRRPRPSSGKQNHHYCDRHAPQAGINPVHCRHQQKSCRYHTDAHADQGKHAMTDDFFSPVFSYPVIRLRPICRSRLRCAWLRQVERFRIRFRATGFGVTAFVR